MNETEFPLEFGSTIIYAETLPQCGRDHKHTAEREAVQHLVDRHLGSGLTIAHTAEGAPFVAGFEGYVSVSHGAGLALLAIDPDNPIGIDIDAPRPQLLRIARRFMTPEEYRLYGRTLDTALAVWTAKEATFKAAAIAGLTIGEIRVDLAAGIATARSRRFKLHHICGGHHTICLAYQRSLK